MTFASSDGAARQRVKVRFGSGAVTIVGASGSESSDLGRSLTAIERCAGCAAIALVHGSDRRHR